MSNLYNANDGLTGRDGGPYLDLEQAKSSEIKRAVAEGREPNLVNPPADAGIVLVTAKKAMQDAGVNLPSMLVTDTAEAAMQGIVDSDDNPLQAYSGGASESKPKSKPEPKFDAADTKGKK